MNTCVCVWVGGCARTHAEFRAYRFPAILNYDLITYKFIKLLGAYCHTTKNVLVNVNMYDSETLSFSVL